MLNGLVFSWHLNLITLIVLAILCLLYTVSILFAGRGGSHPPINIWRVLAFVAAIMLSALFFFLLFVIIPGPNFFPALLLQVFVFTPFCLPLLLASCTIG